MLHIYLCNDSLIVRPLIIGISTPTGLCDDSPAHGLLRMIMNKLDLSAAPKIVPGSIEAIILMGLHQYGRKKTFAEILNEAGISNDDNRRLEAATSLEASGLIEEVSYQLPVTIRASLTAQGKHLAHTLSESSTPKIWLKNLGARWGLF